MALQTFSSGTPSRASSLLAGPAARMPTPTMGETLSEIFAQQEQGVKMTESIRETVDPRYQSVLKAPEKREEKIFETPSVLTQIQGRLHNLTKTDNKFQKFVEKNSAPARWLRKTGEDINIGLRNFVKSALGVEKAGNTEEEVVLANNMRKYGMFKEADEMLQDIQDRRINNMTERELQDQLSPVSRGEAVRRTLTQGIAEVVPSLFLARGAGSKRLAGKYMKNFLAENAAESFAFTSLRHNYDDQEANLPQEFWNDYKYVFPMAAGLKIGGAVVMESAGAFRELMAVAKRNKVNLSPASVKSGLEGNPDDAFNSVFSSLSPQHQLALKQEWKNQAGLRESREIFKKGGKEGTPGIDYPAPVPEKPSIPKVPEEVESAPPPKRTKPRPDEVQQEFRMDKLNLDPQSDTRFQAIVESLGLSTRKVQTMDEVKEMAKVYGLDAPTFVKTIMKNGINDAGEVKALADVINSSSYFLSNQVTMLENAKTVLQKEELMGRIAETQQMLEDAIGKFVPERTSAGRILNAYKLIANNTLDPAYWLLEAQKHLPEGAKLSDDAYQDLNNAIVSLVNRQDRIGLAYLIAGLRKSTPTEKLVTLWKAGMLTSPTTPLANAIGGVTMAGLETIKDIPATVIDWGVSQAPRLIGRGAGKRTKALTLQSFIEQAKGAQEGGSQAMDYFKTGIDRQGTLTKYDIPRQVKFNNAYVQLYVDSVFRSLGAADKVMRNTILKKSLYEQATVKVMNLSSDEMKPLLDGLTEELGVTATKKDLVNFFFKNPDDDMVRIAINDAEYGTFTRDTGLSRGMRGFKRDTSTPWRIAMEFVVPFVKTPTNVALSLADYSPIGFLKAAVQGASGKGQREIIESLSRGITGTGIMAVGAYLAREGLMTGSLPETKEERELWRANGLQAQSIFIQGKWRRLDRMSPFGNLLSAGAEFNRFGKDRTLADRYYSTALGGLKGLTEQSFLKGVSGATRALVQPERYGQIWLENTLGSFVPSILGRIAQGMDTSARDTDYWYQVWQSRLPILAEMLPASVDPFGREVKNQNGVMSRLFDPFNSTAPTGDPVAAELFRLQHPIGTPNKALYNPEEYRQLLRMRGTFLNAQLASAITSRTYQTLPPDAKNAMVDALTASATAGAQQYMRQVVAKRLLEELKKMDPHTQDIRYADIKERDATVGHMIHAAYPSIEQ